MFSNTGDLIYKRKNTNPEYGDIHECGDDDFVGVDLNRNYGFAWNKLARRFGVDTYFDHPCKETYQGPYPFSESETRALRDFIFDHTPQIKIVYNWHA